jgi:hypothetical protein
MSWFRRRPVERPGSSYDEVIRAYRTGWPREAVRDTRRITTPPWFETTPQNKRIHQARIPTRGLADAESLDRELSLRARGMPVPPPRQPGEMTYDEMRMFVPRRG